MKRILMLSGGAGSWGAGRRVVDEHGNSELITVFTDTGIEDEDLYRFLTEAEANLGGKHIRLKEGRTPWEVYRDRRFIGNAKVAPCSEELKREVMDAWLDSNCDASSTVVYVGVDWTEKHRLIRLRAKRVGWTYEAPLCEPPYRMKREIVASMGEHGIKPPRLYAMGFSHNNCGGFCCKAGQAHFANFLRHFPDRYREHEEKERLLMAEIGSKWGILRDRGGGKSSPLTLAQFRERLETDADNYYNDDLAAGCGCAL